MGKQSSFDHFKALTRSCHPLSSLTFADWDATRPYLIRLEEVGIFAQGLREWQDRCQFQIEIIEMSTQVQSLEVYAIYENYTLRDRHDAADFGYM